MFALSQEHVNTPFFSQKGILSYCIDNNLKMCLILIAYRELIIYFQFACIFSDIFFSSTVV